MSEELVFTGTPPVMEAQSLEALVRELEGPRPGDVVYAVFAWLTTRPKEVRFAANLDSSIAAEPSATRSSRSRGLP